MNTSKTIDKYYLLSEFVDDDIEVIAVLIKTLQTVEQNAKILKKLEANQVDSYDNYFDTILDNISVKGLRDIAKFIRLSINDKTEVKKEIKTKESNLLDFI